MADLMARFLKACLPPLGLAWCCAAGVAAIAAPVDQEAKMAQALHDNLVRSFVLDKELVLDPALRKSADELGRVHLARIGQLLPVWLGEERKLQSSPGKAPEDWEVYFAVWARVLNELALWQVEAGDAAYEAATLEVLKGAPQVCHVGGDPRFSDFSVRVARLQAMPETARAAALATERELLSHWGRARPTVAPWPAPLPQDGALALLNAAKPDSQQRRLALPPLLADELLSDKKTYAAMHREQQCRFQQWWLQESLHKGGEPAAVLNAFRYGTLIGVGDRFVGMFETTGLDGKVEVPTAKPVFPKVASRFLASGSTTMSAQMDAAGKPRQASVIDRKITVPGIRGVRPVAFENVFDQSAVDYAMDGFPYDRPAAGKPFQFQLVWTLEAAASKAPGAVK
jgi:hypothetical protein